MQAPKRILDLILVLFFISGFCLDAGPKTMPPEGYPFVFFKTKTLAANATASIQITQPVSLFSIYLNQSASFTFNAGAGTGFNNASSSYWYVFTGSRTVELVPQEISSGTYLWIKNGASAQTFKFWTLGN